MSDQDFARRLYRKLLAFYPRAFREQLAESMEQTFNDLCNERKRQTASGSFGFVLGLFAETSLGIIRERVLRITTGEAIKYVLERPRSAAVLGLVLALPYMTLLSLLLLGIEPPLGPLEPLVHSTDPDKPDVVGSLMVMGTFVLSIVAFIIVRAPIVRTMRAGGSLFAHRVNLLLAIVIVSYIAAFLIGIIVDQYPCWMGVPNCD